MHRVTISILSLSIMMAPALLEAQAPRMQQRPGAMGQAGGGLAERLLTHRDALRLSIDQVAQIRRVQTQLEQQNRPLAEQLRAGMEQRRDGMQQRRDDMQEQRAAAREHMQQLTPEQRADMRQRHDAMRGEMQELRAEFRAGIPEPAQMRQHAEMRQHADSAGQRPAPMRGPAMVMRRPAAAAMRAGTHADQPEELRATMQQMRQNTARATEQLMEILTPDQRAALRTPRTGR